ncbi:MAG TPA: acyl-CoA dehydrogenase [Streptosporangiaceae bacterium]|nr:acyl-CoA dehydrogenase [Streptosporangiaceae bacterium]
MNDERDLLRATVEELLAEHCTAGRVAAASRDGWDAVLWRALEDTGLTLAGASEEAGGSGGDLTMAAGIAVAAGAAAAPVPLAETLAAGMLLARAGAEILPGPLTLAVAEGPGAALQRVPYGRLATTVAVGSVEARTGFGPNGDWLAVIPRPAGVTPGRNLAGEPRDEVPLGPGASLREVPPGTADYARRLLRLFRSLLITGAAQRALDLTVAYVNEREQFGRALARFPTVQQEIARMAGEVALISAATQAAVAAEEVMSDQIGTEQTRADQMDAGTLSAVVAAKAQASDSAGTVAAIAHQLHGAIGTTEEHRLRLTTTRLWSWRDEDGTAAECSAELGRAALGAGRLGGGLWAWLAGGQGTPGA